jgi:hypothetical protein
MVTVSAAARARKFDFRFEGRAIWWKRFHQVAYWTSLALCMLKNIHNARPAALPKAAGFTTTAVQDDGDWVRLPKPGQHLCGFTRSHLYALYTSGQIRSVSIRRLHHKRGIRLLYRPSILAFIKELDAEQNGAKR